MISGTDPSAGAQTPSPTDRPTADDLRALARSAPWRFTMLHWVHRSGGDEPVEAWLQRPGRLTTREGSSVRCEDDDIAGSSATTLVLTAERMPEAYGDPESSDPPVGFAPGLAPSPVLEEAIRTAGPGRPSPRPHEIEPQRRPDGLVAARPDRVDGGYVHYDDPMHQNYLWVAMLDPEELAEGVEYADVHEAPRHGRRTWWAVATPTADYVARCAQCCDLLPTPLVFEQDDGDGVQDGLESAAPDSDRASRRSEWVATLPSSYRIGLDVQTGIVVEIEPIGAVAGSGGTRLSNEILAVDEPLAPPAATLQARPS